MQQSLTKNMVPAVVLSMIIAAAFVGVSSVSAAEGENRPACGGQHEMRGQRGFDLVPEDMREAFREDFESLSEEEREALREEHRAMHEEQRANLEAFVGLTGEELKDLREEGVSMGEVLADQGLTEDDAREYLTAEANARVDVMVERHDLTEEEETTLRDRIVEFVEEMLARWFK